MDKRIIRSFDYHVGLLHWRIRGTAWCDIQIDYYNYTTTAAHRVAKTIGHNITIVLLQLSATRHVGKQHRQTAGGA